MIAPAKLLGALPEGLRDPLLEEYRGIIMAWAEGKWRSTSIDAGRFCEVVFTVLDGAVSGSFAAAPSKPKNFPEACRGLESKAPVAVGDRSLRFVIPRVLPGIYEIRNNRNVGHVGGDVVSNQMDATYVRDAATWVMAELVRIFHGLTIAEAQDEVDALVERPHPLVWERDGMRRVLDPKMTAPDKTLVLLHGQKGWTPIADLRAWVKYGANYKGNVVDRLAEKLLVEVNKQGTAAAITPLGSAKVEGGLLSRPRR